jgi:predicted PurR-regulated permease PerM
MPNAHADERKHHITFLLVMALAISLLFFRMIQSFILALLLGAIFAGLAYPFYTRLVGWLGGRRSIAAGATIILGLLCVVIPVMVFLGLVADEAVGVSKTAVPWVEAQVKNPGDLARGLEKIPLVEHLAPHKSQLFAKSGELANKVATFAAASLAGATRGTAEFFLSLFVMLYAMFHFLLGGSADLDRIFRYLPLSDEDRRQTLSTFTSVTRATLLGAIVIGVIQGGLAGAAFAVAGIKGALFWTAMMAVLSIIPGIGVALVWVPAVVCLAVEGRFGAAVGLGLWCALMVGSVDNFLRPQLVGKGAGLPDLLVLLGTLGGLILFGPVGILVGPVIAALFVTMWHLYASAVRGDLPPLAAATRPADADPGPRPDG